MAKKQITRRCQQCGESFTRDNDRRWVQRFCSLACLGVFRTTPPLDRFMTHVHPRGTGCWLWTAFTMQNGYGKFGVSRSRNVLAHRWIYEAVVGLIPNGLGLDHLCRVRHCVNPTHLEPVTQRENNLRGDTVSARCAQKTHCSNGHQFTAENTLTVSGRGPNRRCRICYNAWMRRYGREQRAKAGKRPRARRAE